MDAAIAQTELAIIEEENNQEIEAINTWNAITEIAVEAIDYEDEEEDSADEDFEGEKISNLLPQ